MYRLGVSERGQLNAINAHEMVHQIGNVALAGRNSPREPGVRIPRCVVQRQETRYVLAGVQIANAS